MSTLEHSAQDTDTDKKEKWQAGLTPAPVSGRTAARRDVEDTAAIKDEKLFKQINCSGCHIPLLKTGVDIRLAAISNQRIQPFTDLLLHDMGPDLADGRSDLKASGTEWKTPAL